MSKSAIISMSPFSRHFSESLGCIEIRLTMSEESRSTSVSLRVFINVERRIDEFLAAKEIHSSLASVLQQIPALIRRISSLRIKESSQVLRICSSASISSFLEVIETVSSFTSMRFARMPIEISYDTFLVNLMD